MEIHVSALLFTSPLGLTAVGGAGVEALVEEALADLCWPGLADLRALPVRGFCSPAGPSLPERGHLLFVASAELCLVGVVAIYIGDALCGRSLSAGSHLKRGDDCERAGEKWKR